MEELRRTTPLVDDAVFAGAFVKSRQNFRPRSAFVLKGELRQRGVDSAIVTEATEEYDEAAACARLAQRKRSLAPDKLRAYLLRQRFPLHLVNDAVRAVKSGGGTTGSASGSSLGSRGGLGDE